MDCTDRENIIRECKNLIAEGGFSAQSCAAVRQSRGRSL